MNKPIQKPAEPKSNREDELKKEIEEWKSKYLRAIADYQNFEKRVQEDRVGVIQNANKNLILKLLPFLDHLDQAEVFIKDPGLKLTKESFYKVISSLGVKEFDLTGKEFDPHVAEAVEVVNGEKDNMIVETVAKGYELFGNILRPARVKVSRKI